MLTKRHRYLCHDIFSNNISSLRQTAALKEYYDKMTDESTYEKKIKAYEFFSKRISPMLALTFVGIYWYKML